MTAGTAQVEAAMLWGMEARPVTVEVSMSSGVPGITIVGRPDAAVAEAKSRVRCAMKACGFKVPRESVTVNLSPAEAHKSGTAFDLPIALAILAATGQVPTTGLDAALVVGELSLQGEVLEVRGMAAYAELAAREGRLLVAPQGAIPAGVGEFRGRFVSNLAQLRDPVWRAGVEAHVLQRPATSSLCAPDLADVAGQGMAKRALTIAAAGGHGMLMVGPPGVGKTMLARCVPSVLEPLDDEAYYQTMLIHSLADVRDASVEAGARPFRAPHHSASLAGLVGGGKPVRPGEVSLAHNGVLFLDEMAEFSGRTLQALRQPIEERMVRITRAEGTYAFPCDFQLVAASNPCPCGHLGDPLADCTCSETAVRSYQARLAGPLMDRIDIVVRLERPTPDQIMGRGRSVSTDDVRAAAQTARAFARERRRPSGQGRGVATKAPSGAGVARAMKDCLLDRDASALVEDLLSSGGVSVRGVASIVRVARTVADIDQSERVREEHVCEAISYRDGRVGA